MSEGASWHAKFKDSAYIFAGGLSFDLTEGDILAVFSQYGEIVDVNLVRNEETGKSRGFAFICYEDQRSTVLAVDNLNGAKVLGRTIKVEHVEDYRLKDEEAAKKKDWKCGCGAENFKFRDNCLKCGGPRPSLKIETDHGNDTARIDAGSTEERWGHDGFRENEKGTSPSKSEAWEGAAFKAVANADDDDAIIRELKARKEVAMTRARAAAQGLPIPGGSKDGAPGREAKRAKKEKKSKKEKKEKKSRKERHSSSSEEGAIRE